MREADYQLFMSLAIAMAKAAAARGEVPVGAVLLSPDGLVIAADGNRNIEQNDPSAHAEIVVLRKAGSLLGNYRLSGTTLVVSLEPCIMCVGAMVQARIKRLVYAASDPKSGAFNSEPSALSYHPSPFSSPDAQSPFTERSVKLFNHRFTVLGGVMAEESARLIKNFFRCRRKAGD